MHGQAGRVRLPTISASPKWSKWPWVTSRTSQRSTVSADLGLVGLREPRVEEDHLAAGRRDLAAGVAVPRERRVAIESPSGTPPCAVAVGHIVGRRRAAPCLGYTRPRACRADRGEPRVHQLDGADRPSRSARSGRSCWPGCGPTRRAGSSPSPALCAVLSAILAFLSDRRCRLTPRQARRSSPTRASTCRAGPRSARSCVLAAGVHGRCSPAAGGRRCSGRRAVGRAARPAARRAHLGRWDARRRCRSRPARRSSRSRPAACSRR